MTDELIDFSIIENQKENVQSLPGGRSARALAQLYSPPLLGANPSPNDQHSEKRAEFERELANIDEADDPLDVYDRYVKWTLDTYPSAQATPQSRLLPLLERATKAFQASKDYKNDVRYVKIWLHYIRFFSDAPREVFVFLSRHGIGEGLALYYEEFAAWLENAGRWNQAEEIYRMGIEKEARPSERLMRKYGEFERRKEARSQDVTEPSSPALPAARPALAAKTDPFAATPSPAQQQQSRGGGSKKPKMAIFTDGGESSRPVSGNSLQGWDSIGTLADRKKENTAEAKPMAGQKLMGGKTNIGVQKMMIFKDESSRSMPRHFSSHSSSSSSHEQQCVLNDKTGRLECVFVNLEAVYPEVGNLAVEYCFEELRARHRGWLNNDWRKSKVGGQQKELTTNDSFDIQLDTPTSLQEQKINKQDEDSPQEKPVLKEKPFKIFSDAGQETSEPRLTSKQKGFQIFEDRDLEPEKRTTHNSPALATTSRTLALNDENDENTPPSKHEIDAAKKARREERANRTRKIKVMEVKHIKNETQTIKLNMDSPKSKPKRRKSVAPEPTMTINTKEAMDEIYGIFSAPLPSQSEQQPVEEAEEESEEESEDDEDDYTTGDESTATGKLSAPASDYGDETRNELLDAQRDEDRTDVSAWSDFDTGKHVPKEDDESGLASAQTTTQDAYDQADGAMTPVDDENPQTRYVPVAPEDYEPPVMQMRDMSMLPNHRLPFMTPIVEQTESSLGIPTQRCEKEYFGAKTPSRKNGMPEAFDEEEDDEPPSSPFEDLTADMEEDKRRVLQPIRTKSTKGTLSLGHGTSKAQIDAKLEAPATADTAQNGPIIKDLRCNPMDPYLRQSILSEMNPHLTTYEGYHEHLNAVSGKTAEIKKYIKQLQASRKSQSQSQEKASSIPPMVAFPGAGGIYTIKRELGAGTFAPVYLVENSAAASLEEREDLLSDDDEEDQGEVSTSSRLGKLTARRPLEAIKMEEPPSTWEFYILRATHRRLGVSRASESIVKAHEMHLFRDECFLVEEYRDQGTLLDLVNIARLESGSGGGMDEMLAMFFSIELLRTVEAMHAKHLIHGDLKGDNVLVRFDDPGLETDWSPTYFPSGAHGWFAKGICLIDFGRGIDMKHFDDNVAFIADWKTSEADCAEMRELRPWTYQIDYHGLAGIVHSLLFGKYMETSATAAAAADSNNNNNNNKAASSSLGPGGAAKTYRIRESFKRYWQTEIWSELFALLLNPSSHVLGEQGKRMPVLRSMRACRERMEAWLEENCERGIGLKGMISRMEGAVRERKRKSVRSG